MCCQYFKAAKIFAKLNLRTLDISHSFNLHLSILLHYQFTNLTSLILNNCGLASLDLRSLAQANIAGKLPKLEHLDISGNNCQLVSMFSKHCKWNNLLSLDIRKTSKHNAFDEVRPGFFTSLQEIRFSQYTRWPEGICWPNVRKLHIDDCDSSILNQLAEGIKSGHFRELLSVCLTPRYTDFFKGKTMAALRSLCQARIECHVASPPGHPFTMTKCICQQEKCDSDEPRLDEGRLHLLKQRWKQTIRKIRKLDEKAFKTIVMWIIIIMCCYLVCVIMPNIRIVAKKKKT